MSLFTKLAETTVKAPVNRLFKGNFAQMGAIKREPDTRTREEIIQTIDYYAEKIPEIKQFASEIKQLNTKHMGTIADTLELSTYHEMLPTNIDMSKISNRGISYRQAVVEDMIEASKTNPQAMELADAIINNTDSTTSKYVLEAMTGGIMKNKELANHMHETAKIVPNIAKEALDGPYLMDYHQQENFVNWLNVLLHPQTKTDKITSLFKDVAAFCEKQPENLVIEVNKFLESNTPKEKIQENLKVLPEVLKMMGDKVKNFDIVEFVTKNTNLY